MAAHIHQEIPMRAYRLEHFGNLDGLTMREEPTPKPGAGEVLVRVRASSLNFRDLAILNGLYPIAAGPGMIPQSDAAGVIETVGPRVERFKEGDRVTSTFMPTWYGGSLRAMPKFYATEYDGWLTEYKVVSAEALCALPDHLSFEEGSTLPCAAVTAWTALKGVGPSDTVLTQGTGGVSLFALQFAKVLGARAIATTSSEEKATRLKSLGADSVIDYMKVPEWSAEVRALTDGHGVDRVIEVGGPGTLAQSIKSIAYHGQVSLVGALAAGATTVDFMSMFMSQATYQPIGVGSRSDLEDLNRVISQHKLRPVVDKTFSFEGAKAAWRHFAERQLFGKVVITH
jgi:NADPH:quinone reductase-like Zn-dependent oxidoreductase